MHDDEVERVWFPKMPWVTSYQEENDNLFNCRGRLYSSSSGWYAADALHATIVRRREREVMHRGIHTSSMDTRQKKFVRHDVDSIDSSLTQLRTDCAQYNIDNQF